MSDGDTVVSDLEEIPDRFRLSLGRTVRAAVRSVRAILAPACERPVQITPDLRIPAA